jgi:hypothetical protein
VVSIDRLSFTNKPLIFYCKIDKNNSLLNRKNPVSAAGDEQMWVIHIHQVPLQRTAESPSVSMADNFPEFPSGNQFCDL